MNNKFVLEFIWWIFTAVIVAGILYPILSSIDSYPFLVSNVILIATFITLVRYIFLLPYTFIQGKLYLKGALILISPVIIFLLMQAVNQFQTKVDEQGWEMLLGISGIEKVANLSSYIRNEFLFFGVGSVISAILLPFRLIASIWTAVNKGARKR